MGAKMSRCSPRRGTTRRSITIIADQGTQTIEQLSDRRDDFPYFQDHFVSSDRHAQRYPTGSSNPMGFKTFSRGKGKAPARPPVARSVGPCRKLSLENKIPKRNVHNYENWTIERNRELQRERHLTGSTPMSRSNSVPLDMFLIDISNQQVRIGEPISINIRHLLLNKSEENLPGSSSPMPMIADRKNSKTTQTHEEIMNCIPDVCEHYPNVTVDPNQSIRRTLHAFVPPQCVDKSV